MDFKGAFVLKKCKILCTNTGRAIRHSIKTITTTNNDDEIITEELHTKGDNMKSNRNKNKRRRSHKTVTAAARNTSIPADTTTCFSEQYGIGSTSDAYQDSQLNVVANK